MADDPSQKQEEIEQILEEPLNAEFANPFATGAEASKTFSIKRPEQQPDFQQRAQEAVGTGRRDASRHQGSRYEGPLRQPISPVQNSGVGGKSFVSEGSRQDELK